ncbi:hypothetical protein [Amycolatopsis anabasis]|uniref:hypothetical protein n=1 Tax=Amycolatopsis anabasis TaxID=1840409 RepID=UPI00131BBCCD|nr:hypothetical protein [Amycolatopsis anabasis]
MLITHTSALDDLAEEIRKAEYPLADHWYSVHETFRRWARRPGLRARLRDHLRGLSPEHEAEVIGRSRETTTHFAWCLLDREDDEFSFWLHEYKPQRDWRQGYADSIHNHRYHFCTTMLHGSYRQERYNATVDPDNGLITSVDLRRETVCHTGHSGVLLASEFHRIPSATDNTMTFLVKSRPVNRWSISFDPSTRTSHRHVPVETRLGELTERI